MLFRSCGRDALPLEVHDLLQDLVAGGDHAGIGLEAALRDDEARELLRQVHVGHLQRGPLDGALPPAVGGIDVRIAGVDRRGEGGIPDLLQALL